MLLPSIRGVIKRRVLVNFRVDPDVVIRQLPEGLRPKLQGDHAIAGICLIRLEHLRPQLVPAAFGVASENAAHRVAVVWHDEKGADCEGVFIPIRHTASPLVLLLGGRLFPGVQNAMPVDSAFSSLESASEFFRGGSVGYSPARDSDRLEGLKLVTPTWRVEPLAVSEVRSSWLENTSAFPPGSVEFDCALVMRDVAHSWAAAPPLYADCSATVREPTRAERNG